MSETEKTLAFGLFLLGFLILMVLQLFGIVDIIGWADLERYR